MIFSRTFRLVSFFLKCFLLVFHLVIFFVLKNTSVCRGLVSYWYAVPLAVLFVFSGKRGSVATGELVEICIFSYHLSAFDEIILVFITVSNCTFTSA